MENTQAVQLAKGICIERIMGRLDQLAQIGRTAQGGVTRLGFSEEDRQARRLVVEWMREAGLDVQVSPIGNIVGTLGSGPQDSPVAMAGSHVDTVANGGQFDGALGVVAAIEAAQIIAEARAELSHSVAVACFALEESARFGFGCLGSRAMIGQSIDDRILHARDLGARSLAEAVYGMRRRELGLADEARELEEIVETVKGYVATSRYPASRIRAFVELHIEQGPVLIASGTPIGVVTAIAAPTRYRVTFQGEQGHSGTTPMAARKDALAAAAEVILAVERRGRAAQDAVATVGVIAAEPNVMNVIPGVAHLSIDVRSAQAEAKSALAKSIREEIERIAQQRGIRADVEIIIDEAPELLSDVVPAVIEESAKALGYATLRLPSGAGHDAAHLATVVRDTGMIFVPSRDGVSHDPREWTDEQDILRGAQVLLLTMLSLAQ